MVDELATYMGEHSIGTVGDDLFIDLLPLEVSACVSVMGAISRQPDASIPFFTQYVDVWARNANFDLGKTKIQDVADLLHQKANYELGDYHIYLSYITQMPQHMDTDVQKRHLF